MIRNVSLRHLRCFVEVANSGSFTVAASRLFLTQSSLTATIQQFEEAVGLKLFDRNTRRVAMTDEAMRFKEEADKILRHFDSAVSDLHAFSQSQQGHIRIAGAASVIHQFVANAVTVFRQSYPNVTFSLRDAGAEKVEQMVMSGDVDFAVTSRHKGYDELSYTPLLEDRYGVVCRDDYPLAQGRKPMKWSDLTPENFVLFSGDTGIGTFLREQAGDWQAFRGRHDEISSTSSLYAVLRLGNCYSVLPALAAATGEFRSLAFRELRSPVLAREVCLITRRLRSLSPTSQRILEILLQTMREADLPAGVTVRAAEAARPKARRAARPVRPV